MGDIKRQKKKFKRPTHPWQKARIDEERQIKKEYGLKNKKEIWKSGSKLKTFKTQAKKLIASDDPRTEVLKTQLLSRLHRLGILSQETHDLDAILSLDLSDILDRRLQTRILKLGLARSPKQARQFITHGHIVVGDRKVTAPSYVVPVGETIEFSPASALNDEEHPERSLEKEGPEKEEKKAEKTEEFGEKVKKIEEKTEKEEKKEKDNPKEAEK